MSDILRYVTLDAGGRPKTVLDLNDQTSLTYVKDSLVVKAPGKSAIMAPADRRYGGARQRAEITDNGQVSWSSLVMGGTADVCIEQVEELLAQLEANPTKLLLEWRPDGASQSALYQVRGTGTWDPKYSWAQFRGAQSMVFDVQIPVAPLAQGLPYDIGDSFEVDTRSDYTYDSGASGNEEVSGGVLKGAANLSTENRAIHTARGYQYADAQATAKYTPGGTLNGFKGGVVLKRSSATTYVEAYVTDNGTNSSLNIDKVVAGVRTNLATTNLAARIKGSTAFWVRARIEGGVITAEHFTSAPTPCGNATTTNNHTFAAGEEAEKYGAGVKGAAGRVWVPKAAAAELDQYSVEPYTYRNVTTPNVVTLGGTIPGSAPCKADIVVSNKAGAGAQPIFALLAWAPHATSSLATVPFGIVEAESGSGLVGWASTADAEARNGKVLKFTAAGAFEGLVAEYELDPSVLTADDFSNEVAIEVWARVKLAKTLIGPTLILSATGANALGQARFTDEWGSRGRTLVVPTAAAPAFCLVRLGTLRMLVDPLKPLPWLLRVEGDGSGNGEFSLDDLILVAGQSRACSPTGKTEDNTYPGFSPAINVEWTKTVKHDLSALANKPNEAGFPQHGLGGQLLELAPGENDLLVKLSSTVPDAPVIIGGETLAFTNTIHAAITPRWFLARSGS